MRADLYHDPYADRGGMGWITSEIGRQDAVEVFLKSGGISSVREGACRKFEYRMSSHRSLGIPCSGQRDFWLRLALFE